MTSDPTPHDRPDHDERPTISWSLILRLALAGVLVLAGGVAFGRWSSTGGSASAPDATPQPSATAIPSPTPVIITEAGVLHRIESTQILQSTVFRIDTLVRAKKEGSWFFNWGGQNLLMFVHGKVTAGIDLKELGADDIVVSQERKSIEIRMPPAKVLGAVLDSYEIEDYQGGQPKSVDPQLVKEGLEAGRKQVASTACEDGILDRASEDARAAFERIVSFADFAGYTVTVTATPPAACAIDVALAP